MKKMIKFLPLVVLPSLIVMACANTKTNNVSQNTVTNDNGITEYTITLDLEGGTTSKPTTYKVRKGTYYKYFKSRLPAKDDIAYEHHTFKFYSLDKGGEEIKDNYRCEANVTIHAIYESDEQHTITWKNRGGTELGKEQYGTGETPTYKGKTPEVDNPEPGKKYTFSGWDPEIKPVTADTTYTAQYTETKEVHTVAFDTKGGDPIEPKLIFNGKTIKEAPKATRKGYTDTNEWFYVDGEEKTFEFGDGGTKVTKDMNLYCKWLKPENVTVSFDPGTESQYIKPITQKYNSTIPVAYKPIPTRVGAEFAGWYWTETYDEGTNFIFEGEAGTSTKLTHDMTLYAKWTDIEQVKLTFKIQDSAKPFASWHCDGQTDRYEHTLTVDAGQTDVDPTTFKDGDYTFVLTMRGSLTLAGWQDEATDIIYPKIPIANNNVNYLAVIVGGEQAIHKVSFYNGGADPILVESVIHKEHAIKPIDPTSTGKVFKYWKGSTGGEFSFDTPIMADERLDAVYEDALYTISFNAGEGSQYIKPIDGIKHGGKVPIAQKPDDPTKEKYDFGGWYTEPEGKGTEFIFDDGSGEGTVVTSNMTLYANWLERKQYKLSFSIPTEQQAFAGWYSEGGNPCYEHTMKMEFGKEVDPTADFTEGDVVYKWQVDNSKLLDGWQDEVTKVIYKTIPAAKTDASYTAVIVDKPITTVTVTFKSTTDGENYYDFLTENIKVGTTAIEPKNEPTEDWSLHDFKGWYTEQEGGELFSFDEPITSNTVVYAQFDKSDTVKITFLDQTGEKKTVDQAIGHKISYNIPYWVIHEGSPTATREGAIGWRDSETDEEITIVTQEDAGKTCEPIVDEIPFDFKINCKAADTEYQYTIDGEISVKETPNYNSHLVYHFDESEETGAPICPDHIVVKTVKYDGTKGEIVDTSKIYDKENGKIDITLGSEFVQYKSIEIIVYGNPKL